MLPELFQVQLDQFLIAQPSVLKLKQQWASLNTHYKSSKGAYTQSANEHLAYILARMPATFAASRAVLEEALTRAPTLPQNILDLGAGPGTLAWACSSVPILQDTPVTQVEKDAAYNLFLQKVRAPNTLETIHASWDKLPSATYDWVTAAFLLCEIKPSMKESFIKKAWAASRSVLILIQPGTPTGYQELMMARSLLMGLGAHILAPCPHQKACPMQGENWCHFKARFQRTPTQMFLKNATRGFEDETYSYLIASRCGNLTDGSIARVISSPQKRSGHVRFDLCLDDGKLCKMTFSKRQKDVYKLARDTDWGDCLTITASEDPS
jgi:ribosomal protein RSM22 (predicted rRNA methylase)